LPRDNPAVLVRDEHTHQKRVEHDPQRTPFRVESKLSLLALGDVLGDPEAGCMIPRMETFQP
jgi:hypothetical protein